MQNDKFSEGSKKKKKIQKSPKILFYTPHKCFSTNSSYKINY
jgi:hypothetical protein